MFGQLKSSASHFCSEKLLFFTAMTSLVFCLTGNNALAQNKPGLAPQNPDFVKYLESVKSVAPEARMISADGHRLGHIPPPVDMSHVKGLKLAKAAKTYATSFDLRDSDKCPSVKDQGAYGTCWSFATCASLESNLMPLTPEPDFSENNLANKAGFDWGFGDGGQAWMSMAYLGRWAGPYKEVDDPYPNPGFTPAPSAEVQRHVQNVLTLPDRTSYTGNDNIKSALTTYGAMYCAFQYDDANYNATNYAYYDGTDTNANHAVTLIGWDDNFLASKFNTAPDGNGAFLLKNSWGTSWGDEGYFWLSYYDKSFQEVVLFYGEEVISNYDAIYQYDPLGWVGNMGTGTTDNLWCANIFTATSSSSLKAVSFYTVSDTCSYDIRIHTGVTANEPVSGTLAATKTGSFDIPGYHTVQLDSPISITNASLFSVAIKLTTPGYYYPGACEYAVDGYSSDATASAGQSFDSTDGTTWEDLTDVEATANFCIKAFTGEAAGAYSISGTVSGDTQASVTISLTGTATTSTTTGVDGTYTFGGLADGSYTVTPSKTGYTFTPTSISVTISGANATGKDFTAAESGSSNPSVTIGSTFTLTYAEDLDKKPTVYALVNGKKKSVKVTSKPADYPGANVNCLWTAKCAAGDYDLYIKGKVSKVKVEENVGTATVEAPEITGVSSTDLTTPKEIITVNGTYFGTKPKVWFICDCPSCGGTKSIKKSCKIVSKEFTANTGASTMDISVPKFKDGCDNFVLHISSGTGEGTYDF